LRADGSDLLTSLTGGYHLAFAVGALFAATAAVLGAVFLRPGAQAAAQGHEEPAGGGRLASAEADY
jgi:hypothetical protein